MLRPTARGQRASPPPVGQISCPGQTRGEVACLPGRVLRFSSSPPVLQGASGACPPAKRGHASLDAPFGARILQAYGYCTSICRVAVGRDGLRAPTVRLEGLRGSRLRK